MRIVIQGYPFEIREDTGIQYPYYTGKPGAGLNALVTYLNQGWKNKSPQEIRDLILEQIGFGDEVMVFEVPDPETLSVEHPDALPFVEERLGKTPDSPIWWISLSHEKHHFYAPHSVLQNLIRLRDHLANGGSPESFKLV